MTWFRLDDGFWCHPKTMAVSDAAAGLLVKMGCYSSHQLTDGWVPAVALPRISCSDDYRPALEELERAGFVTAEVRDGKEGYQIHDFCDYNPSREDVLSERRKKAEAGRSGGLRSAEARRSKTPSTCSSTTSSTTEADTKHTGSEGFNPRPVPSRPVPSPSATDRIPSGSSPEPTGSGSSQQTIEGTEDQEPKTDGLGEKLNGAATRSVFDYWRKQLGHPTARLDEKRRRRIEWVLREYGEKVARAAIDGCAASEFHRGANEHGKVYDDPSLIFRDAAHVERFAGITGPVATETGGDERRMF